MAHSPILLGIIREGKTPPDSRVVLPPTLAAEVSSNPRFDLSIQPSSGRCFSNQLYEEKGLKLDENVLDRDVLIGVKEVPITQLVANKTYFFFSHTHKKQAYNRPLLQAALAKHITLIDYELLTDDSGKRLIAFGRFAGMVGAHHALRAWGIRSGKYELDQMKDFDDYEAAKKAYAKTDFGDIKIVTTGSGRVGKGAVEVLLDAGFTEVTKEKFFQDECSGPVFTIAKTMDYAKRKDGQQGTVEEYRNEPALYESAFDPYLSQADVLIQGIFWNNAAPAFFTVNDTKRPDWRIQVIADVTCDIAPLTSIPTTLKASTIADPYFGFDPSTGAETDAWSDKAITMMTVDNLPNELPKDASKSFGSMFMKYILPELLKDHSDILQRATICSNGQLTKDFSYLEDFVNEA